MKLDTETVKTIIKSITDVVVQSERGMLGVMVSTSDGFPVCHSAAREFSDPQRLAAISSSLVALADTSAHTADIGSSECLVVEGAGGRVVLYALPNIKPRLLLTVLMTKNSNLGSTIYLARTTAARIASALADSQRQVASA
ncbi:MAG: roadblock/LC7 domain-containing protein [Pseudomonadota bacterium]